MCRFLQVWCNWLSPPICINTTGQRLVLLNVWGGVDAPSRWLVTSAGRSLTSGLFLCGTVLWAGELVGVLRHLQQQRVVEQVIIFPVILKSVVVQRSLNICSRRGAERRRFHVLGGSIKEEVQIIIHLQICPHNCLSHCSWISIVVNDVLGQQVWLVPPLLFFLLFVLMKHEVKLFGQFQ